ncbi:MAG: nuclear transport factor 2 family protein [Beijerinckiaceae bacterium]
MSSSEQRAAEWECQQLLNKAIHLLDSGRWDDLALCFTEDAAFFRPTDPNNGIIGREAIHKAFSSRPPRITNHMLANTWFEGYTGTEMQARSRVLLLSGSPAEKLPAPAEGKLIIGEFSDTLRKAGGQWLIAERKGRLDLAFGA